MLASCQRQDFKITHTLESFNTWRKISCENPNRGRKTPAMCLADWHGRDTLLTVVGEEFFCFTWCFGRADEVSGAEQYISVQFSHSLSRVQFFVTPWTAACQASLSVTHSQSLLKFMSIESVTPSNHLILCRPLLLLPSIFPSIRVFSNESVLHITWPEYWNFSISPSNEYSGLISFRMDWLDLLAVQGTLKSLLQHHSSKASILWCSAFSIVQLSCPYMTTGKTITLTRQTFVGRVMAGR